jgi:glucose-1-phosphate adenylyltransferase
VNGSNGATGHPPDVLTLILGGGRGDLLYPLTRHRSKAAVPFAGKYRFIDIPISNCINSGLHRIYVLTQFLSVSLHRHISNTYKFDPFGRGFVAALPAQVTNEEATWYQGTADAIRRNFRYLEEDDARLFLVLPDDQLYRFDFRLLCEAHEAQGADVTIAAVPVTAEEASGLGILRVDRAGRILDFVEKPQSPAELSRVRLPPEWCREHGITDPRREYLGSTGIYLFRREAMFDLLRAEPPGIDFARDVFPRSLRTHHFHTYRFPGYWAHLETVRAYHAASLALASDTPPFDFYSPEGVIYTRMRNLPASRLSAARLEQCLVSDGCTVAAGADLERCVLGVRSRIGRDVRLRDAVLMGANFDELAAERVTNRARGLPDIGVGDGSVLERVIVDKNCRIGRNVRIVNERGVREAEGDNYVIRDGIVVLPNGAVVPDGTVL